jgi:hypothetical protein
VLLAPWVLAKDPRRRFHQSSPQFAETGQLRGNDTSVGVPTTSAGPRGCLIRAATPDDGSRPGRWHVRLVRMQAWIRPVEPRLT